MAESDAFALQLAGADVTVYSDLSRKILLFRKLGMLSFALETGNNASRLICYIAGSSNPKMGAFPSAKSHRL